MTGCVNSLMCVVHHAHVTLHQNLGVPARLPCCHMSFSNSRTSSWQPNWDACLNNYTCQVDVH
jgi:hypothetical protein